MAKSEQIRQAEKSTIFKMLMDCNTDTQIMNELRIPYSTYYRYKSGIYKECADKFHEQRASDAGFYSEQLNNRLTKYLKTVEKKLEGCEGRDAATLAQTCTEIAKAIFDLGIQGIEILDAIRAIDKKMYVQVHTHEIKDHSNSDSNRLPIG